MTTIACLVVFAAARSAHTSELMDALKEREKLLGTRREILFPRPTTATISIEYSAQQIEAVKKRARKVWRQYLGLRPRLRKNDLREQAYAQRAMALRHRISALERLMRDEKRNPSQTSQVTVAEALTWLDRATAVVEYDHDRVTLRMAQEAVLPPDQPFCICAAPAHDRVSPHVPRGYPPVSSIGMTMAAGEAESLQLIIVPLWEPLEDLRVELEPLFRRDSVEQIPVEQQQVSLVESIRNIPEVGREQYWPDPIRPLESIDIPATASQTLLLTIRASDKQVAGVYAGDLGVSARNVEPMRLKVFVRVRPFPISQSLPTVAYWVRNEGLKSCFSGDQPRSLARECEKFLGAFGLGLFRPNDSTGQAPGWQDWLPARNLQLALVGTEDPYSLAASSSLSYRQAGWAAWQLAQRGLGANRWLIHDFVASDKAHNPPDKLRSPLIWGDWSPEGSVSPPGLVHFNCESRPEPTLRLVAVRDGIEDFAYQRLLADRLSKAKECKAVGWWRSRKWRRLLRSNATFLNPAKSPEDTETVLLRRREEIAEAIEQLDRALKRKSE